MCMRINVSGIHRSMRKWARLRRLTAAAAGLALATLIAAAETAAPLSFEERLAALEAQVIALRMENEQLRRDMGVGEPARPPVVRPAGKEQTLTINGLVQVQAEFGDKGDSRGSADRIRLRRVRLGASGRFLHEFDFKVEGEYAGSSVVLTDGFFNWSRWSWASVKAGQFKTPFGYEFLASNPRRFTIERTLGTERLTLNRQVGVQASGDVFESRLGYTVGAFNGNGRNVTTNANETDTWTLGANWRMNGGDLKFQLNYNLVDVPPPTPLQKQLVLRTQVVF